jgi:hypothetical protein
MQNLLLFQKPLDIRLSVFPGNSLVQESSQDREISYRCWKSVWGEVFQKEMQLDKTIYSDEFSRQDIIVSLFSQERCVGLAMIRLLPLDSELSFEDSFFRFWTAASLKKVSHLTQNSPLALASAFTVHPDFRGRSNSINWKSLLLALFLEKFLTTEGQIMITAARKLRSNEKLCQKLGAQLIEANVPYVQNGRQIKGELADLLYWPRNLFIDLGSPELNSLKERIWIERKDNCFKKEGERYAA